MQFTEEHLSLMKTVRDFASNEIYPFIEEWESSRGFPAHDLFKKLGKLGMLGVLVPSKYGGSGLSYNEYVTVVSEIAKVCGSIGLSVAAHNSLCVGHILKFGTEEQKMKWLPKLSSGELIGAWALTETGTGSVVSWAIEVVANFYYQDV